MSAFSAALGAIYSDPNMAADIIYTPAATGTPATVRAVRSAPDEEVRFGDARMRVATVLYEVRISDLAAPVSGDAIVDDGVSYVVQGSPERDVERLTWTIEAVPA